jgi:hypothetical protein
MIIAFQVLFIALVSSAQDLSAESSGKDAAADSVAKSEPQNDSDLVIAYYLHGNRRCATCRKLEAFSTEAMQEGFKKELSDSLLVWRVVNYDQKGNEHYIKDYSLYTKALILSRVRNGREVQWKNLDKIWELVGDREKFIAYVQEETRTFLGGNEK